VLPAALPRVDLIAAQVDGDPSIVDWALERGARGLVVAGTGHGTMAGDLQQALAAAAARGCLVVRATRLAGGAVLRNAGVDDDAHGFVAAGSVTPHKARAMTCAALAAQLDAAALQSLFDRC
jgi:L-asparaginase